MSFYECVFVCVCEARDWPWDMLNSVYFMMRAVIAGDHKWIHSIKMEMDILQIIKV